jgi:ATP-dependent exoDNAse (exonuclease V) alpha subunit
VRHRLVADWWAAGDPENALMIAFRRVDVAELNGRARALMRASGRLGPDELRLPGGTFSAGDLVLLRQNDRRLGVANGHRAVIVAVDPQGTGVVLDVRGRRVALDRAYLEQTSERVGPSLVHGYAITGHSVQGLTCDRAFVLVTSEASRECYTALSRGRQVNRIYAVMPEHERDEFAPSKRRRRDGRDVLAAAFARADAQALASEVGPRRVRERDLFHRGVDFGR